LMELRLPIAFCPEPLLSIGLWTIQDNMSLH